MATKKVAKKSSGRKPAPKQATKGRAPLTRSANRKALAHVDSLRTLLLAMCFGKSGSGAAPDYSALPFASFVLDTLTQWHQAVLWADQHNIDFWAVQPSAAVLVGPLEEYAAVRALGRRNTVRAAQARALQLVAELPRLSEGKRKKVRDDLRRSLPHECEPGYRAECTRPQLLDRLCATHEYLRSSVSNGPGSWLSAVRQYALPATAEQWAAAERVAHANWNGDSEALVIGVFAALGVDGARHLFSFADKRKKRGR